MKYFKNPTGEVFAYETDAARKKYGAADLVSITPAEAVTNAKVHLPQDYHLKVERLWRNTELLRSDIELNKLEDCDPKSVADITQWRDYRKALRSWPEHKDFPNKDKRPVAPDA